MLYLHVRLFIIDNIEHTIKNTLQQQNLQQQLNPTLAFPYNHNQYRMYQSILREFNKQGLSQNNIMTQHEVKKALDSITFKNTGIPEFDMEVAHEIWNQTKDNLIGNQIKLSDYITTMVKAENILKQQIQLTQQQLRSDASLSANPQHRNQLLNNLFSYSQDHRTLTLPFGLQQVKQSKEIQQSRIRNSTHPSKSILFSANVDEREQSTDLKIVFVLVFALLVIQLIVMFQKNHFFTLLGVSGIICAYVLNYFEKKYVIFMLAWTALSAVLDLVWLIVKAGVFWNGEKQNLNSNIQIAFLRFIVFMVCIEILLKIVLFGLLFKYRDVGEHVKKKVNICGLTFLLDGKPDQHNLIVQALGLKTTAVNPFQNH